ncbi:MAG TPA: hypothetical protein VFD91_01120 [Mariniphaga sp.]|nr:hypothetical protein [Mariniphaga sp.]
MNFFYLVGAFSFFRLFFLFRDKPLSLKGAVYLSLLQILPLLIFKIELILILFAVLLIIINFFLHYAERNGGSNKYRFLSFIFLSLLTLIFSSYGLIEFNQSALSFLKHNKLFPQSFLLSVEINYQKITIVIFGTLILLNEINFLIRYFFELLQLYPVYADENRPVDEREYNAGRVIGMLERILIYLFILANEITVIGFIIAAKGFTRFKELDKRDFAEYVLIGTLLSAFFALIISFFIKELMNYF